MSDEQSNSIYAISMDIWDTYIKAVQKSCQKASIVFALFNIVRVFGKVIDKVMKFITGVILLMGVE